MQTTTTINPRKQANEFADALYKYASDYISVDRIDINISCYKYIEKFGFEDVQGFISWCISNNETEIIPGTLLHDLNAIHDDGILPRTSGYSKYNK